MPLSELDCADFYEAFADMRSVRRATSTPEPFKGAWLLEDAKKALDDLGFDLDLTVSSLAVIAFDKRRSAPCGAMLNLYAGPDLDAAAAAGLLTQRTVALHHAVARFGVGPLPDNLAALLDAMRQCEKEIDSDCTLADVCKFFPREYLRHERFDSCDDLFATQKTDEQHWSLATARLFPTDHESAQFFVDEFGHPPTDAGESGSMWMVNDSTLKQYESARELIEQEKSRFASNVVH